MSSTLTTRAAWYEKNGEARDVMVLGSLPLKAPGAGEVCVRLAIQNMHLLVKSLLGRNAWKHCAAVGAFCCWCLWC